MTELLAISEFSVRIAPDFTALVIETRSDLGHMTVPVPVTELVALAVRDRANRDARYTIPSGHAPHRPHWVELVFVQGRPWQVGPLTPTDAAQLAMAFDNWRTVHPLDREPIDVTERELVADPTRYHMRLIRTIGTWRRHFERSAFANAWLEPPASGTPEGVHRIRVVGTWIYPDARADGGFGHFGLWPGLLRAQALEILETADPRIDELTGLMRRRYFEAALERARLASLDAGAPLSFALLDLDRMKAFNEEHGHAAGDREIRQFAHLVHECLEGHVMARWEGDKIAIALHATGLDRARGLVGFAAMRMSSMTFSAGVVQVRDGETLDAAAARATELVQAVKRRGGNGLA